MKGEGRRRFGKRLVRWIVLPLVLLLLVGFFGSNLVLQSGWVRGKLAGKLGGGTPMKWSIARASWSPWGGGRLGGLKVEALYTGTGTVPPVLEIEELRVQPYWKSLLKGRLEIREIRVKSPRAKVPVELMRFLMSSQGSMGPMVVPVPKEPGAPAPGEGKEPATAKTEGSDPSKPQPAGAQKQEVGGTAKQAPAPPPGPRGRLVVEDGELQVYLLARPQDAFVVSGIGAEVPFAGSESTGWIRAAGVRLGEVPLVDGVQVPLNWQRPTLRMSPVVMEWNGLRVRLLAAMRLRGRPAGGLEIRSLPGQLEPMAVPGWPAVTVAAERVEMMARFQGDPGRPATWTGNLVGVGSGLRGRHAQRGDPLDFEQSQFVLDLRGGVLRLADLSLRGERFSLMGNGVALTDGRVAAVFRLVADPEYAEAIREVATGSMVSRGPVQHWLHPMETPDRYYRDVHLQGAYPNYAVDLGREREPMEVGQAWQLVQAFVKREQREDGRFGSALPGGEGGPAGP